MPPVSNSTIMWVQSEYCITERFHAVTNEYFMGATWRSLLLHFEMKYSFLLINFDAFKSVCLGKLTLL